MECKNPEKVLLYGNPDAFQEYSGPLSSYGYSVKVVSELSEAKHNIYAELADVMVLDLDDLGDTGLALCRKLKSDPLTYNKPIIIATGKSHSDLELAAIQAGVDDYALFPMDPSVLLARISMIINRSNRLQMSNPLTGLPGNLAIEESINRKLEEAGPLSIAYADLDNFKVFNDKYGYSRGDNVIRLTAMVIKEAISNYGKKDDFYGHIGGDDFILITDWDCVEPVCTHAITAFDTLVPFQYDDEDRLNGFISAKSRQGEMLTFPIITLSIGVVTNRHRELRNVLQVADLATEMKCYAKQFPESIYVLDKRKDDDPRQDTSVNEKNVHCMR